MTLVLLAKTISCSAILFGYYWMFLRNKKFHRYNRFYLLIGTFMSIVFPFCRIPVSFESKTPGTELMTRSIDIISVNRWDEDFGASNAPGIFTNWLTVSNVLFIFYVIVVFGLLHILLRSLSYLQRLANRYPFEQINNIKFYSTTEPGTPFSFLNSIFWNRRLDINSREGQQIFRHELFHVKQQHSADIIFLELVCIFCWINPFFHLIKREMKAIHEFLADQHAVDDDNQQAYAELLILQSLHLKKASISNYFFQNHIKRRIAMITHKTKKYSYWSRLLVLPLAIFLFCAIALYAQNGGTTNKEGRIFSAPLPQVTQSIKVVVDAGHGGNDAGARNNGLQEKDISLSIARQIKQHASTYNVDVVMTRDEDSYPSLKERSALATSVNANLMISIHVGSAAEAGEKSGFDIYVTNKNQETITQSKLLGQSIADRIKKVYQVGPLKQRVEKGIWILDAAPCPAVLIECGFMTDPEDLAFIANPKNQEHIAKIILEGIVSYQSEKDIKRIDTVPNKNKTKESVNIQLEERNAEAQRRTATDKKLQDHRREMQSAQQKIAESLADSQRQRGVIQKQQRDIQLREKMVQLEQEQRNLDRKQNEIQALQEMKIQKTVVVEKQKELQLRQQLLEQAIEKKSAAVERETKELNLMKQLAEQQSIQKRQQILLEQQLQLDIKHQELKEVEMRKIEEKNREMMETKNQREGGEHVLQKDDLKESGMPDKKKPANNRSAPKSNQRTND